MPLLRHLLAEPVAATTVELNSDHGAVCAPDLLSTPHVSADIARVAFGDQSNEPGIDPRWRLSLNLLRPRKSAPRRPTFDFAPQEGNRLVSVHAGARRVVRSLSRVTSNPSSYAEGHHGGGKGSREAVHSGSCGCRSCSQRLDCAGYPLPSTGIEVKPAQSSVVLSDSRALTPTLVGTLNPRPAGADLVGPVQPSFTMIRTRSRVGGTNEPRCLRQPSAATR